MKRNKTKRKRKEDCISPLLESPKRTKVHAQRKFAQGSNVNSPVITPVKEIEKAEKLERIPTPVELLPIKRPNTEDFLTFLCFRGTPLLPHSLNFFNTASIVDTNGQVHEIKSESPKNGPIDTSVISKNVSGSSDRPFIAFGVRKRADPIVISKQMDKKRRHALALQALRRKYQEQKMAKIRAVTISKLSEKVTSKSLSVKSDKTDKSESIKKVVPKTKVIATKHIKVTAQTVKALRSGGTRAGMNLRSFRGRFVQKELPFRAIKKHHVEKKIVKCFGKKKIEPKAKSTPEKKQVLGKSLKSKSVPKSNEISYRVTRSNCIPTKTKIKPQRPLKRRIILPNSSNLVKPRVLRSQAKNILIAAKMNKRGNKSISANSSKTNLAKSPIEVKLNHLKTKNITPKAAKKDDKESDKPKLVNKSLLTDRIKSTKKTTPQSKTDSDTIREGYNTRANLEFKENLEKPKLAIKKVPTKKEIVEKLKPKPPFLRPTRKTKEAATIYMEILSHKLVNEAKIDEDAASVDSFPELPNVRKTEERENELKAASVLKIKPEKVDNKIKIEPKKKPIKVLSKKTEEPVLKNDATKATSDKKEIPSTELETPKIPTDKFDEKLKTAEATKNKIDKPEEKLEPDDEKEKKKTKEKKKDALKRKSNQTEYQSDSDEVLARIPKLSKPENSRRKTRNSYKIKESDSDDSDESYHVDVKIPTRKKKITRSQVTKPIKSVKDDKNSGSDLSDYSTTSSKKAVSLGDKSKKSLSPKDAFSDSDEEPLSKLTVSSKLKDEVKNKAETIITVKPKRECAKRPQNYLPMFSSSDDEEKFFHGFSLKDEAKQFKNKITAYCYSSTDLFSKDVKRRFGKEKVNMSNEQIHKWLKDSAMAENDVKKEFIGEDISPENPLQIDTNIDIKTNVEIDEKPSASEDKYTNASKSPGDRKVIFRKEKTRVVPSVSAFSVNNESSIYAFGEDNDDVLSTPFRRPSRRPSSTATSRSEDEQVKNEEQIKPAQFRKPCNRVDKVNTESVEENVKSEESKRIDKKVPKVKSEENPMIPPCAVASKSSKKNLDYFEDIKYKIPSSPSASSSSSAKLYKKNTIKPKSKAVEMCNPIKLQDFPSSQMPAELVEAPTFYPTDKEFQDPLDYIGKIASKAEQFGICRIVPPNTFKPECKVSDDMRFSAYNQYVHKMLYRWGPNVKELMAIKKYLHTQNINLKQPPWIGGIEIDLPRLYQTVQTLGGLKEVIEKKKWPRVSELMKIPKSAQDRVTKLDDIYCKYLLPYETLSPDERGKLFDEVETEWAQRESKILAKLQENKKMEDQSESDQESDDEMYECIVKGRNMALNAFYRIARNTMSMWFKNNEPTTPEVEQEFWKHVSTRLNHICVHSGSIDSGSWGYGFAVTKNSPFARHAWNLKVLTNNSGSVLRSLGPVMGMTVPTLHVGMAFSACCWYRDPHSLPWIEYLHTGGSKIWYGIPSSSEETFRNALVKLVPNYCRNQGIWLPSDTVMLPPSLLIESGVSLCRTVQETGQFIVVFPKAFTSSISTGYVVSESVFFAPSSWLKSAKETFNLLRKSSEPSMFSLDKLILCIINDSRTNVEILRQVIPAVEEIVEREKCKRSKLKELGVSRFEALPPPESPNVKKKRKKKLGDEGDYECESCRMNLYISMVVDQEEGVYCLDHAMEELENKNISAGKCKILYTYNEDELNGLVTKIHMTIEQKLQKKVFNKFSGMPTLLNK